VTYLNNEIAKLGSSIADQRQLIELLKEKRQTIISRTVTNGLNPNVRMKDSGIEWIGRVPEHWDLGQLRYMARQGTSITYGIVQAGPDVEGGVPYIRTSDMSGDFLPAEGYLRTSSEIDAAYARSKVSAGDVVIAIRATIGKPLIVPEYLDGANLTQGTAKFSPGIGVSAKYICMFLRSTGAGGEFARISKGATFKEITLEMLRKFPVLKPPLAEQHEIVAHLEFVTAKIDALINFADSAICLLNERRNSLISAAVTGRIKVCGLVPSAAEAA
jgi:type I restriction enzyme S subunit